MLTGFGHQAVVVFFVLSGYFVGGSVIDAVSRQRWSWSGYASRRLTRLWLVLIPSLLLTLFWDRLGASLSSGRGYNGEFSSIIFSGPTAAAPLNSRLETFLGNVAFLQTITCPVLGTNGPLWSLANEFWYYVLFPFVYLFLHPKTSVARRITFGVAGVAVTLFLPGAMLNGFGIWLLGCAVHGAMRSQGSKRFLCSHLFFGLSCIGFLASLAMARAKWTAADFCIASSFAGTLPFLISRRPSQGWYTRVSASLSEMSYTLYVVHFPLLGFLFFTFRLPARSQPAPAAYLAFFGVLAIVVAYAAIVWWLFEKRTDIVRKKIESVVFSPPESPL